MPVTTSPPSPESDESGDAKPTASVVLSGIPVPDVHAMRTSVANALRRNGFQDDFEVRPGRPMRGYSRTAARGRLIISVQNLTHALAALTALGKSSALMGKCISMDVEPPIGGVGTIDKEVDRMRTE
jgi:hypothetical protein